MLRVILFSFLLSDAGVSLPSPTPSESTLAATERILEREQDIVRRVPLLLRWMTLIYEVKGESGKAEANRLVSERLKSEIASMQKRAQSEELDPLLRQYAWRQAGEKNWSEAVRSFQAMKRRLPKDDLVFGDSLLASGLSAMALEVLENAKTGLPALASYKMAWAYLQLNDNQKALKEFDHALKLPAEAEGDIRAQAFRERIIPFVETYTKTSFTGVEASELRALAEQIFSTEPGRAQEEMKEALKKMVEAFLGKGQTSLARQAFDQLLQIEPDQKEFSIGTAPLWLGIYRAKLEHDAVAKLIASLPSDPIPLEPHSKLLDELQKTSTFYERLVSEENKVEMKQLLQATYEKTLQLFPGGTNLLAQRVNAAKLAWDRGDYSKCLEYLNATTRTDRENPEVARLYAQCRLKRLDDYRAQKNPELKSELKIALVDEKLYRPFPAEQIQNLFDGLVRILLSELSQNREDEGLRSTLQSLLQDFPFERNSPVYREAKSMEAQLKFVSLGGKGGPEAGDEFFALFQESDPYSETGQKALGNSILLSRSTTLAERCSKWVELQGVKMRADDPLWERCYRGAEEVLDLERMHTYLSLAEKTLTEEQRIRLGLVELAHGKSEGQARLQKMKSKRADQALQAWVGPKVFVRNRSASGDALLAEMKSFQKSLRTMKASEWEAAVAARVKTWEKLDAKALELLKQEDGASAADLLYARVEITEALSLWIKKNAKAKAYDGQMEEVVKVWMNLTEERRKDCTQRAYYLSRDFSPAKVELCPEEMSESDLELALKSWRERSGSGASDGLASDPQREASLQLVTTAMGLANDLHARYWLLTALDGLKAAEDRARVFEGLATRTKNSVYWEMALSLNPHSLRALEGFRTAIKINGVQDRIVAAKIKWLQQEN